MSVYLLVCLSSNDSAPDVKDRPKPKIPHLTRLLQHASLPVMTSGSYDIRAGVAGYNTRPELDSCFGDYDCSALRTHLERTLHSFRKTVSRRRLPGVSTSMCCQVTACTKGHLTGTQINNIQHKSTRLVKETTSLIIIYNSREHWVMN